MDTRLSHGPGSEASVPTQVPVPSSHLGTQLRSRWPEHCSRTSSCSLLLGPQQHMEDLRGAASSQPCYMGFPGLLGSDVRVLCQIWKLQQSVPSTLGSTHMPPTLELSSGHRRSVWPRGPPPPAAVTPTLPASLSESLSFQILYSPLGSFLIKSFCPESSCCHSSGASVPHDSCTNPEAGLCQPSFPSGTGLPSGSILLLWLGTVPGHQGCWKWARGSLGPPGASRHLCGSGT